MGHQSNEVLRKLIHIAFGFGALTLRWLPWWAAALVAAAAVVGNILLLHKIVGRSVSRHERGWDAGIVLYPAMVGLLIVVFRNELWIAAVAWAVLAFGDGTATLAGKAIGGPRLPWNREKTWSGFIAFVVAGAIGGAATAVWMGERRLGLIALATVIAAIVESLPLRVDDNITVPVAAATTLIALAPVPIRAWLMPEGAWIWIAVNTLLAVAGFAVSSVDTSGAVGGWLLGTILILAAGWPMYVALLLFFVIGTGATKLGYKRKAARGLAQERGGRRSFSHAFSNVGVAAICAIAFARQALSQDPNEEAFVAYMMGIASLATAAADTTASEIGQLFGRRTFLPLSLKPVPVGTEGAISVEGTVAGIIAAAVVSCSGLHLFGWRGVALMTLAAAIGSYVESVAGNWNRKRVAPVPNGVLNFFNTAVGAAAVFVLTRVDG